MNPFKWRREHQIALLLGAAVGIALGFITGYMHENVHYANPTFSLYLTGGSAFRWGLFGALVGGTTIYIRQLLHA
jgi:hypothetical protein